MAGGLPINKHAQTLIALLILTAVLPALAVVLPTSAKNESGVWTSMASMPTARGGFGTAVVNGRIYAIGGLNGDTTLNIVEEYNPITNQWTTRTPMPTARSGFAIAVYRNQIYVIGGTVGSGYIGNNEVYDPASDTWQTLASMTTPRDDLCASVVDDKIYLIGGKKYSSDSPTFYRETDITEVYDIASNTWSTAAAMPTGVQGYSSAVLNDEIFIIGGSREPISPGNTIITDTTQVFNPKTGEWNIATQLPNVNSYGAAAATEGYMAPPRIFYIGGFSTGEYTGLTRVYFPENNSWNTVEPMPTARAYLSIAVVNDILYAMGGFDGTNWLNNNEQYKPAEYGTVAPKVQITSPENKTYTKLSIAFTFNRATEWMAYSLDNKANVTIQGPIELVGLSQGSHDIVIYANDSLGNMGSSNRVFFSIDTIGPEITIITPQNQSYDSTDIQLSLNTNENVTRLAYRLDNFEEVPILGNVTLLALSEGSHRLTVYATDELGNVAEKTVYFSVALFPILAVVATVTIVTIVAAGGFLFLKRRKSRAKKPVQAASNS